jgi:hypothetical protein
MRAEAAEAPAPCDAGTPSAVGFDGLRVRIPYGPSEYFSLGDRFTDWEVVGDITIRMAEVGSQYAFYGGPASLGDEFYVRLDLGDRPVDIGATFTQQDSTGATCTQALSRRVRGYRRILLPSCGAGLYRPRNVVIACGDANFRLERLRWRRWNRSRAYAHGTALANDCLPFCAAGTFHSYRVRVRASRIRRCSSDGDRYRYTRLRISYGGSRPPGSRRREIVRIGCY